MNDFEKGISAYRNDLDEGSFEFKKGYWCAKAMTEIAEVLTSAVTALYGDGASVSYDLIQDVVEVHLLQRVAHSSSTSSDDSSASKSSTSEK